MRLRLRTETGSSLLLLEFFSDEVGRRLVESIRYFIAEILLLKIISTGNTSKTISAAPRRSNIKDLYKFS